MPELKLNTKAGRKPIPEHKKRKTVTVTLSAKIIDRLREDAENGIALSPNQMATKIIERHYRKIDKKKSESLEE